MNRKPKRLIGLINLSPTRTNGKQAVPPEEQETPALMLDLMMQALRVRDTRINAIAIELLGRFGANPVPRLVHEAATRKNRPAHRVRCLKVLQRIQLNPGLVVALELLRLMNDPNPDVSKAATELLGDQRDREYEAMGHTELIAESVVNLPADA